MNNDSIKKHDRRRAWFQAAWFAVTNGYLRGYTSGKIFTGSSKALCVPGLNCYSCPGALGACPIGSLQAVLDSRNYKISLYVFGLLTAFGVFFGRLVCGWLCPFGFVQDLLYKIKTKFKRKNLPGHRYLRWLRFGILLLFVIILPACVTDATGTGKPTFCEFICPSGMLLGGIPLTIVNASFRDAIGLRFWWKFAVLLVIAVASIFYFRPFCKYLCPLGAIYGVFNPVSTYRLEIDHDKCIRCGACQRACGMDIRTFETPNSMECIRCGTCMKACPKGAITSSWAVAQKKYADRHFIEEPVITPEKAASLTAQPKLALFLGIAFILAGACGAYGAAFSFYNMLDYSIVLKLQIPILNLPYCLLAFAASGVLFVTGIHILRFRSEPVRLLIVPERAKTAASMYGIALILLVIAIVLNINILIISMPEFMYFPILVFAVPSLLFLSKQFQKAMEGKTISIPLFVILLAVVYGISAYTLFRIVTITYRILTMS